MKIFRPLNSTRLTQGFGESKACVKVDKFYQIVYPTKVIGKPVDGLCPVNFRDFYTTIGMKGHNGLDMATWNGQPIYFPVEADCKWWVKNYQDSDGGLGIDVYSDRPIDIGELPLECGKMARSDYEKYGGKVYVKFRFHHILKSLIEDSENNLPDKPEGYRECKVKFGQSIALADNTGASSGSHLHWGMKIVHNNGMTIDGDNGYYGAVDFTKYYYDKFVLDEMRDRAIENLPEERKLTAMDAWKKVMFELQLFLASLLK